MVSRVVSRCGLPYDLPYGLLAKRTSSLAHVAGRTFLRSFSHWTPSLATASAILYLTDAGQSLRRMAWPSGLVFFLWSGVRYPPRPTRLPWRSGGRPERSLPGWVALAPSVLTGLIARSPGLRWLAAARSNWAFSLAAACRVLASSGWLRTDCCSFWRAGVSANWTSATGMEPEGNLLSGVAGTLLWLLAPGLGVNANVLGVAPGLGVVANGSTLCLFLAGVQGLASSSWGPQLRGRIISMPIVSG